MAPVVPLAGKVDASAGVAVDAALNRADGGAGPCRLGV